MRINKRRFTDKPKAKKHLEITIDLLTQLLVLAVIATIGYGFLLEYGLWVLAHDGAVSAFVGVNLAAGCIILWALPASLWMAFEEARKKRKRGY